MLPTVFHQLNSSSLPKSSLPQTVCPFVLQSKRAHIHIILGGRYIESHIQTKDTAHKTKVCCRLELFVMLLLELSCERKYNTGAFVWDIFVIGKGPLPWCALRGPSVGPPPPPQWTEVSQPPKLLLPCTWSPGREKLNVSTVNFIHRKYDLEDWLGCLWWVQ